MNDEEIVDLFCKRSEDAIKETSSKYQAYLSKISFNILSDYEDSKECVNDTYLAAWNSMPESRPRVLSSYLAKITRRISIDLFRKKNRKKRYASEYALSLAELEENFPENGTPEQEFEAKLLDEAINAFVRTLPEKSQRVFVGRYYFFDSVKEIAEYCGISEANTKAILFRTRQDLKNHLKKKGVYYEK